MSQADISEITEYLYVSSFPKPEDNEALKSLGISLIISMPVDRPHITVRSTPSEWLHVPTVDSPLTPILMHQFREGVEAALPVIDRGGKVLVHCRAGVHRSVAMACCILIGKGMTAHEAMRLVKEKRLVADPFRWYIRARIERFESYWEKHRRRRRLD